MFNFSDITKHIAPLEPYLLVFIYKHFAPTELSSCAFLLLNSSFTTALLNINFW